MRSGRRQTKLCGLGNGFGLPGSEGGGFPSEVHDIISDRNGHGREAVRRGGLASSATNVEFPGVSRAFENAILIETGGQRPKSMRADIVEGINSIVRA